MKYSNARCHEKLTETVFLIWLHHRAVEYFMFLIQFHLSPLVFRKEFSVRNHCKKSCVLSPAFLFLSSRRRTEMRAVSTCMAPILSADSLRLMNISFVLSRGWGFWRLKFSSFCVACWNGVAWCVAVERGWRSELRCTGETEILSVERGWRFCVSELCCTGETASLFFFIAALCRVRTSDSTSSSSAATVLCSSERSRMCLSFFENR